MSLKKTTSLNAFRVAEILSKSIWEYMGVYGSIWEYMGVYGREYMGVYGSIWEYMGVYGSIRECMECMGIWEYVYGSS